MSDEQNPSPSQLKSEMHSRLGSSVILACLLCVTRGAFARVDQHGLASPNGPGVGRPAPTAATQLVCAPVPIQPGPGELVFVTQYSAGLKRQPPPTAEHILCLPAVVLGLAQRERRTA